MIDINQFIKKGILKAIVKPNASKTEVLAYDETRHALRIAIAAVPDKDKANTELLKFLKKQTGRKCKLKTGAKSREKVISFY